MSLYPAAGRLAAVAVVVAAVAAAVLCAYGVRAAVQQQPAGCEGGMMTPAPAPTWRRTCLGGRAEMEAAPGWVVGDEVTGCRGQGGPVRYYSVTGSRLEERCRNAL